MKHRTAFRGLTATLLSMLIAGIMLTSCNVYDDNDDCQTNLQVEFVYDYNMKFADAFAHEVKTIRLYAYDESGNLALQKEASVSGDNFKMDVNELKTETNYDFVVWALGENRGESYDFGNGSEQQLTAKVKRSNATVTNDLTPLFHGRVTAQKFPHKYGTTQTVKIPLVRDTKNIKVVLQQVDETRTLEVSDYTMTITDDNGYLAYDNSLLTDEKLTYMPWSVYNGEAGVGEGDTKTSALIEEFSINRIFKEGHQPRLTVANASGETIISIPLVDYFLLVKGKYNSDMSDQEYLDRQDSFDLVFFLSQGQWLKTYIYINSWRVVVPQNANM